MLHEGTVDEPHSESRLAYSSSLSSLRSATMWTCHDDASAYHPEVLLRIRASPRPMSAVDVRRR